MFFAAGLVFAVASALSVQAQAPASTASGIRVAVINTAAFDAKDGITRYLNAMNALDSEFKPLETELQGMVTKYQNLGNEIKKLQDQATAGGPVPIDPKTAQAKVEEYQNLEVSIKRKEEDGKRRAQVRQQAVLGPVLQDISKAMQEFANQKGIDLILDISKLDGAAMVLAYNPAKADVTKEFITFFNARPAGAATAATPR
jgi:Skp family chaperone for outer membrane proteins